MPLKDFKSVIYSAAKPVQSQKNNAREKAFEPLLSCYFADFKKVFAGWILV